MDPQNFDGRDEFKVQARQTRLGKSIEDRDFVVVRPGILEAMEQEQASLVDILPAAAEPVQFGTVRGDLEPSGVKMFEGRKASREGLQVGVGGCVGEAGEEAERGEEILGSEDVVHETLFVDFDEVVESVVGEAERAEVGRSVNIRYDLQEEFVGEDLEHFSWGSSDRSIEGLDWTGDWDWRIDLVCVWCVKLVVSVVLSFSLDSCCHHRSP